MVSGPIGRDSQWSEFRSFLDSDQSALLLIGGLPGSGRSQFMRRYAQAAQERGWKTIGMEADQGLVIEATTRLSDIRRVLLSTGGVSVADDRPPGESPRSFLRRLTQSVTDAITDEDAILAAINEAAPILISIDGYDPTQTLGYWFLKRLVPRIRKSDRPVQLVISDRPEALTGLRASADCTLDFGPPDRLAIAEHFRQRTADAIRPLTEQEVSSYSAASAADPALLKAFDALWDFVPRKKAFDGPP